ncbi:MAG: hypothetical protein KJI71_05230 [Patescibacteria group bacterium]|nr:hypothetical protein [Patescibacteria group bacterium]
MIPYLQAVRESDLLIFSTNNNIVGKGVYQEVKTALQYKIPLYVLKRQNRTFAFYGLESIKIINERNWTNYAEVELALMY